MLLKFRDCDFGDDNWNGVDGSGLSGASGYGVERREWLVMIILVEIVIMTCDDASLHYCDAIIRLNTREKSVL